jgi:hypothetical protein
VRQGTKLARELLRTPSRNCLKRGSAEATSVYLDLIARSKRADVAVLVAREATFRAPQGLFRQFQDEVRRFYLLVTRAELFRRCRTRRNPAISVKRSIPEDRSTLPAMPSNHLQHTDARDEASGQYSTADVLLTKPPMFWSEAFRFYGFCR